MYHLNNNKYNIIGRLKNKPKMDGITKSSFTCNNAVKHAFIDRNKILISVFNYNKIVFNSNVWLGANNYIRCEEYSKVLFGKNFSTRRNCFFWIGKRARLSFGNDVFLNNNYSITKNKTTCS